MPTCQDSDYSGQNYILRACKNCNAAYSKQDLGRLGMDVNLINMKKAFKTEVEPCFQISEDLILPTGPALAGRSPLPQREDGVSTMAQPPTAHAHLRSRRAREATTTRFGNRTPALDEEYYNALDHHLFGYEDEYGNTNNDANSPTTTNTTWENVSVW